MVKSVAIKRGDATIKLRGISIQIDAVGIKDGEGGIMFPEAIPTKADWYNEFTQAKRRAMEFGGSLEPFFSFDKGIRAYLYTEGYDEIGQTIEIPNLRYIQATSPDEYGRMTIIGEKYLNVSKATSEGSLNLSVSDHYYDLAYYYITIYKLIFELYNALNSISARFLVYNPDGDPSRAITYSNSKCAFGPMLATLLQYQALVAVWNHHAWKSSMVMQISEASGAAPFVLGYVNLDCHRKEVNIKSVIKRREGLFDSKGDAASNIAAASPSLTLYFTGEDKKLVSGSSTAIAMYRNWKEGAPDKSLYKCDGSGFLVSPEDASDNPWLVTDLDRLDIEISIKNGSKNAFNAEDYYYAAFAIALPTGVRETYSPNTSEEKVYHKFEMETSWDIGSGNTLTKYSDILVPAANVTKINQPAEEGGK